MLAKQELNYSSAARSGAKGSSPPSAASSSAHGDTGGWPVARRRSMVDRFVAHAGFGVGHCAARRELYKQRLFELRVQDATWAKLQNRQRDERSAFSKPIVLLEAEGWIARAAGKESGRCGVAEAESARGDAEPGP